MTTQTKTTWRKVKLGEVTEIIDGDRGANYPQKDELLRSGYCVFLDAKNVSGTKFDFSSTQFISERKHNLMRKGQLERGDFVLTTRGTVGNIAYYDSKIPHNCMRINSGMVIFRPRHDVITDDFFYSFLISREFRDQVEALKTGSAQPQLPIRDLKLFEVELPPISDQKRIAEILSTFDDKIELNNKISKTLEQMAQAIFKEWFVKSEKTKVKSEKLSNLGKIICGKTPSKSNSEYFGGNIPFIKIPDMHNQIFILKTEDSLTQAGANSQKTKFIHKNSICVSCIATVGLVAITTEDSQTNQQINTIIPKSEIYLEFLYLALKIIKSDLMLIGSGGSTTLNINTNVFSNIEILTPEESIINKFHELVSPFFNKILQIYRENQKLAALRDLLLPKLMSGEIKV